MFKNFSLKAKLLISFVLISIIGLIIGAIGYYGLNTLSTQIKILGNNSIPVLLDLNQLFFEFDKIIISMNKCSNPYITNDLIDKELDNITKTREAYGKILEKYDAQIKTEKEKELYDLFRQNLTNMRDLNNDILGKINKLKTINNENERMTLAKTITNDISSGSWAKGWNNLIGSLQNLIDYVEEYYGKKLPENAVKSGNLMILIIFFAIGIGFILSIILGITLATSISNSLIKNSDILSTSASQLEGAATQVSSASQELSSGASELASSVEEVTSSIEELQSIIESNSRNVNETELLMHQTSDNNKQAIEISNNLIKAMEDITNNSKKISKINKVIDDIAFQTNILALNAAVEAARAGDAGRGFAVVAEQVKSLAQKSADAAKETNDLIDIVIESVEKGNNQVTITIENINKSKELIEKSVIMLEEVSKAFKEQAKGANQVTKAMSQINSVVQQTASSSEETASSSEEMLSQVEEMKRIVESLSAIALGEKKAKMLLEKMKSTKKVSSEKHFVKNLTITSINKSASDHNPTKEIDIVKPEDKIPLDDFKDF